MSGDEHVTPDDLHQSAGDVVLWAFHAGVRLLRARRASLMLCDHDQAVLTVAASTGLDPDSMSSLRVPLGQGVAGVVAERNIVLLGEAEDGRFISVPIATSRQVEGVLNLTRRHGEDDFGDADVVMARALADHLAVLLSYQRHALLDGTTRLPGPLAFTDMLERELARSHRMGLPLTLLFLRLDHRDVPAAALWEVGQALLGTVRRYDFVGYYGDDTFALLLPGNRAAEGDVVSRLREAVGGALGGVAPEDHVRVGLAHCPTDGTSSQDLLTHAQARLRNNLGETV